MIKGAGYCLVSSVFWFTVNNPLPSLPVHFTYVPWPEGTRREPRDTGEHGGERREPTCDRDGSETITVVFLSHLVGYCLAHIPTRSLRPSLTPLVPHVTRSDRRPKGVVKERVRNEWVKGDITVGQGLFLHVSRPSTAYDLSEGFAAPCLGHPLTSSSPCLRPSEGTEVSVVNRGWPRMGGGGTTFPFRSEMEVNRVNRECCPSSVTSLVSSLGSYGVTWGAEEKSEGDGGHGTWEVASEATTKDRKEWERIKCQWSEPQAM